MKKDFLLFAELNPEALSFHFATPAFRLSFWRHEFNQILREQEKLLPRNRSQTEVHKTITSQAFGVRAFLRSTVKPLMLVNNRLIPASTALYLNRFSVFKAVSYSCTAERAQ